MPARGMMLPTLLWMTSKQFTCIVRANPSSPVLTILSLTPRDSLFKHDALSTPLLVCISTPLLVCISTPLLVCLQVWVNAAAQNFNSIGIAFGSMIAFSSYNKRDNKILR